MSPIGSAHSAVVTVLQERLMARLAPEFMVRCQQPLACADESEPEPDLAVVARRPYRDAHPAAAALVIEVADTSVDYDLGAKAALYAESAVDEYWVIDLVRGDRGGAQARLVALGAVVGRDQAVVVGVVQRHRRALGAAEGLGQRAGAGDRAEHHVDRAAGGGGAVPRAGERVAEPRPRVGGVGPAVGRHGRARGGRTADEEDEDERAHRARTAAPCLVFRALASPARRC